MKELSVEEKAKAYDEAIINGSRLWECGLITRETYEDIFPELKESKDAKIRKYLIESFESLSNACTKNNCYRGDITYKDVLAWLEKQDEQIDFANKEYWRGYREGKQEILDKYAELEKQGKQRLVEKYNITGIGSKNAQGKLGEMIKNLKPADKVEPKFHEGDFVVNGHGFLMKIAGITEQSYQYVVIGSDEEKILNCSFSKMEESCRLWDITKDAKPGDVLAAELGNDYPSPFIVIYKERGLDYFNSYCLIGSDGKFYTGDTGHDMTDIHPATKEQRDLLFQKMRDAGYEWDAEKKELKKIEQKLSWSEEDENMINTIISDLKRHGGDTMYSAEVDWLKQFQPKQEWSKEDERLFQIVIDVLDRANHLGNISRTDLIACVRKLKFLRPQNTWKPGNEQLRELKNVFSPDTDSWDEDILRGLYEQLKQL